MGDSRGKVIIFLAKRLLIVPLIMAMDSGSESSESVVSEVSREEYWGEQVEETSRRYSVLK